MLNIYQTLEIYDVLKEVRSYSHSELSKEKIDNLKMLSSLEDVQKENTLVDEMMSIILRHGNLQISSSFDISKYVDIVNKSGVLSPLELDHISEDINTALSLLKYFGRVEKHLYSHLLEIANKLEDLTSLQNSIRKVVLPNLSISDDASVELKAIRNQIRKAETEVNNMSHSLISKFKDYMSEETFTIRDGHFVLPIKSIYKSKVPGIIHDFSDSGQTTFIEPSSLVELSNKIYSLKGEEKEEIYRLLKELSMLVSYKSNEVETNNRVIGELDFISAKATYGNNSNCFVANTVKERIIDLKGARHPLINKDVVVSNDFYFDEDTRIIIISGPNAGGKTVALKTLGLMVMMNQMGLPIPTKTTAELGYFPRIYADIGDNQSLSDNLSTFAAHISNISTITHFVTGKDLVLIDELGTGTSPLEGQAIAIATTKYLLKKKVFSMISSHFEAMKEYAYSTQGVKNAMMVFSEEKLLPTYMLRIGFPGKSYGLEMARRYHLHDDVVNEAKAYLIKNKKSDINDVLGKLNDVLFENEKLTKSLKEKERLLVGKEKDLAHKEEELSNKKAKLLEDVEATKQELIDKAKKQINEALKVMNNEHAKAHDLIEAKKVLDEINENSEVVKLNNEEININDYVEIPSLGIKGRVIKKQGSKVELISLDGMNVKAKQEDVFKCDEPANKVVSRRTNVDEVLKLKTDVKLELNIIGYHVDEGIEAVSKYLDDCRLRHFSQVRIIHGMGSGQLRKAVHEYLKTQSYIKEFHYGGTYDGGTGATIVVFK